MARRALEQSEKLEILGREVAACQQKPYVDCIQKMLTSKKFKKTWLQIGLDGLQADKSISSAILVQKDGTVIKADDHGGIMVPDYHARHKYWRDLGVAMGVIKPMSSNVEIHNLPEGAEIFIQNIIKKSGVNEKAQIKQERTITEPKINPGD